MNKQKAAAWKAQRCGRSKRIGDRPDQTKNALNALELSLGKKPQTVIHLNTYQQQTQRYELSVSAQEISYLDLPALQSRGSSMDPFSDRSQHCVQVSSWAAQANLSSRYSEAVSWTLNALCSRYQISVSQRAFINKGVGLDSGVRG